MGNLSCRAHARSYTGSRSCARAPVVCAAARALGTSLTRSRALWFGRSHTLGPRTLSALHHRDIAHDVTTWEILPLAKLYCDQKFSVTTGNFRPRLTLSRHEILCHDTRPLGHSQALSQHKILCHDTRMANFVMTQNVVSRPKASRHSHALSRARAAVVRAS